MTNAPLFDRADFRIPPGITHVCAGGEPPFLYRHDDALRRYAEDKSCGEPGRDAMDMEIERARACLAQDWGVAQDEIGFVSSVAEGVSMIAESLQWVPGDNVVLDAIEYPSVAAPFVLRRDQGLEIRVAHGVAADRHLPLVDGRTRVIATTFVSNITGERFELAALRAAADRVGALLLVDFTQAAGYLPIAASVADFAFSACYKWLLGTTGIAVAYWNRVRQPHWMPLTAGWFSITSRDYDRALSLRDDALRFCRGNPAHAPLYVLNSALSYLHQWDVAEIARHVTALTDNLLARLHEIGVETTTPRTPARHAGNVCIAHANARAITDALFERGIYAWNGSGRIRFSFHGYNAADDVTRIVPELQRLIV